MENKSHALAAGTFVLLLLALLVALAVWLTRDDRHMRTYELFSQQEVTGLQPQASVRYKGVNIGKVTDIGFDPDVSGQLLIRIAIDDRASITRSTFATLGFQGVTGLAFVQLDDSGESKVALAPGSGPTGRIPMRPGLMAKLSDRGEKILIQLEESTLRINQLLSADNQKTLMTAIGNMGQAAESVGRFSSDSNKALPHLVQNANTTLDTMKDTSVRVGDSADEARASARAFRTVTERMNEKGGTLDQLAVGAGTLVVTGQTLNAATLPRVNHAVDDAARSARQIGRTADVVGDNPRSLLFGNAPIPPGPGESGFSATPGKP